MNLIFFSSSAEFIDFTCGTKTTADTIESSYGQMFKIMQKHKNSLNFWNAKM